jgi:hypothetical protein
MTNDDKVIRRQETGDGRQETGDRRQEIRDREHNPVTCNL